MKTKNPCECGSFDVEHHGQVPIHCDTVPWECMKKRLAGGGGCLMVNCSECNAIRTIHAGEWAE